MILQWEVSNSVVVFSFIVDDLRDPEPVWDAIQKLMDQGRTNFLFDLGNVVYISSSVLGLFITLYKELNKKGGHLKIVNTQPSVSNLFEITRLDRILEMFDDRQTALKSFE